MGRKRVLSFSLIVLWIALMTLIFGHSCAAEAQQDSTKSAKILIVTDSKSSVYGSYAEVALDFINEAQSLSVERPSREARFLLQHVAVEVPHNDSDATFTKLCTSYNNAWSDSKPSLLLDLTTTPLISATVKSFAKFATVPSASILCCTVEERFEGVFTGRDYENHLVFDPPSKIWIRSVRDFVQHENMTSAAVVLDKSFDIDKHQRMLLANLPCKHLITYLDFQSTDAINTFVTKMRHVGIQNYFIVAEVGAASNFVGQAFRLGVMVLGQRPNFFVLTKNMENVECPQCSEAKLIKLKPMMNESSLKQEELAADE